MSFLYRAAIRTEEAAGALGVIALSDFELRHDIMFLFPKNSNFRADYTTIFRELRACAEETGFSIHVSSAFDQCHGDLYMGRQAGNDVRFSVCPRELLYT